VTYSELAFSTMPENVLPGDDYLPWGKLSESGLGDCTCCWTEVRSRHTGAFPTAYVHFFGVTARWITLIFPDNSLNLAEHLYLIALNAPSEHRVSLLIWRLGA